MKVEASDLNGLKVMCEDLEVGKIKGKIVDTESWKVTHLDIELSKDGSEHLFGARKRKIRNHLAISALGPKNMCCDSNKIDLKVKKGQLHIYMKPPTTK